MLAGVSDPAVARLAAGWGVHGMPGPAPVVGTRERVDAPTAALVGATAAVWHDFDCGDRFLGGHPAAHIVPATLALAGTTAVRGPDLLGALVAGFDVAAAVRFSFDLHPLAHPHGTWPAVGVAAAAALLLGLDEDGLAEAIRIAGSAGLATTFRSAFAGASVRNLYAGLGASAGLVAAQAAAAGVTGLEGAADDIYGTLLGTPTVPAAGSEGSEAPWPRLEIERSYIKVHACARYLHSALDALEVALAGHRFEPVDLTGVTVHTYGFAAAMTNPAPKSSLAARFSLPYALAAAVALGNTGIDAFAPLHLADPQIAALIARIDVVEDPGYSAATPVERPARVEARTSAGTLCGEVRLPRGEPDHAPVSDAELRAKFATTAGRVLEPGQASDALAALWDLDAVADVGELLALLTPNYG